VERPPWAPSEVDLERPSAARMYDYYLGGYHNLRIDREFAEQAMRAMPELPMIMRTNRAFLRRTVRHLADAGCRQFLDLGSGIPTVGNVHEIAQSVAPDATVVYVDKDSVAVAHSEVMLAGNERTGVVEADMRDPDAVLGSPVTQRLIDLDQPVAVLMFAVLHFVPDDDEAAATVAGYRDALVSGSFAVISHATHEPVGERGRQVEQVYSRTDNPLVTRYSSDVTRFLTGFDILEPGVVYVPLWRPESDDDVGDHPERCCTYGAVGRKS